MKKHAAIALIFVAPWALASCAETPRDGRIDGGHVTDIDAYDTARDNQKHINTRLDAAMQLTQDQKRRLQVELLKEIPGDLDLKTLNAVNMLAKVGDAYAAEKLDAFLHMPLDIPGKIGAAAESAITEIHNRSITSSEQNGEPQRLLEQLKKAKEPVTLTDDFYRDASYGNPYRAEIKQNAK